MKTMLLFAAAAALAFAQDNPVSADTKNLFNMTKGNIVKAAEKAPEEIYSFKPTADVRSFGQLIGHVADAQYLFCSAAGGGKVEPKGIEKSVTSKAELVEALKTAFAYCDEIYSSVTDAKGAEKVKFFGSDRTKLGILNFNTIHNYEHYGNIVTYLRLKNIVPPSSEGR